MKARKYTHETRAARIVLPVWLAFALAGVPVSAPVLMGAEQPHLVLNSAGHTVQVSQAMFTPDDKQLISVSNDKTIRIWDLASGETVSILRPQIATGLGGGLCAGAISRDGRYLAAGGYTVASTGMAIYLIAIESGRIEKVFDGHGIGTIIGLAFSPNGTQLASSGGDRTVHIWNLASGACDRILSGNADVVRSLAYSPDGQHLATACVDGTAAIWSPATGEKLYDLTKHKSPLTTIAWSPDGKTLATADTSGLLFLWNADGSRRKNGLEFSGAIYSLVFTPDSRRLLVESQQCLWVDLKTLQSQPAFARHSGRVLGVALSKDASLAATWSDLGGDFYLWQTKDGTIVHRLGLAGREIITTAWSRDANAIAWGNTLVDQRTKQRNPLERAFSLAELDFTRFDDSFQRRVMSQGHVALNVSKDARTLEIKRDDRLVALWTVPPVGSSHVIICTCLIDEERAIVGTNGCWLYLIDLKTGARTATCVGHLGTVRAVAPTPDRRYFLSASTDQTLRIWSPDVSKYAVRRNTVGIGIATDLHGNDNRISAITPDGPAARARRLKVGDAILAVGEREGEMTELAGDGYGLESLLNGNPGSIVRLKVLPRGAKEPFTIELERRVEFNPIPCGAPLLSLYFENNAWIAWTEEGYYACSAGGEKLMGWQVNNDLTEFGTFYPARQFHNTFYRPDVIKRVLDAGSVEGALALADADRQHKTVVTDLAEVLPPKVAIVSPAASGQKLTGTRFNVEAVATGLGGRPVVSMRLLVDGRPYQGDAGLKKFGNPDPGEIRDGWQVELPPGRHRLAVIAASAVSQSVSDEIEVVIAPPAAPPKAVASSLHLVSVGINNYPGRMKLDCAAPDAQAMEQAFRTQSNGLYQVKSTMLLNDRATRKGIIQSLDELTQKAKSGDVAVVFYAGHGDCKIAGQFYLLPIDVNLGKLTESGVSGEELRGRLARLPCTVLLIMDCCYAGSFDAGKKKRAMPTEAADLVRELVSDDQGLVVMCGASKEQESGEEAKIGHGYFSQALIEGLEGKAASRRDGLVYLTGLQNYVEERVRELSHDEQYPTIGKPTLIRSFPLSKPMLSGQKP